MRFELGPRSPLLSQRGYARHRGVTPKAIRKRIAAGDLDGAIVDGRIDPEIADRLLAENTTTGKRVTAVSLTAAKKRKLRAQIAELNDRLQELKATVCSRE